MVNAVTPDDILIDPVIPSFALDVKEQFSRVRDKFLEHLHVSDYGVVADGVTDDYAALIVAVAAAQAAGKTLWFPAGKTIRINTYMDIDASVYPISWESDGAEPCEIAVYASGSGECIYIHGQVAAETTLEASAGVSARTITLADASDAEVGQLIELISTQAWWHDPRAAPGLSSDSTGQVVSATSSTCVLQPTYDNTLAPIYSGATLTVTAADGTEQSKTISSYDDGTKTITISGTWTTTPDNTYTYYFGLAFSLLTVTSSTVDTVSLERWIKNTPSPYIGLACTVIDGTGWKQSRTVESFDTVTGVATLDREWETEPDATSIVLFPQAHKGEINEIVEIAGDVVTLRSPIYFGYDVDSTSGGTWKEDVRVRLVTPCKVRMKNIAVRRAVDGSASVQALRIKYAKASLFEDIKLTRGRRTGLQLERCYQVDTVRIVAEGCDGTYTGYGISNQCSWRMRHRDGRFWGTRRGIDAHSTYYSGDDEYPSGWLEYLDCEAVGGGEREDGEDWGPLGETVTEGTTSADNYGFGSHGPATLVRYINPRVHSVHSAFLLRAEQEEIINPQIVGRCDVVFKVWYGGDHVITNMRYLHPVIQGNDALSDYYRETLVFGNGGTDFRDHLPLRFLDIVGSTAYANYRKGKIRIKGGEAHVRESVVYLGQAGATEWADIEVEDLDVHTWAEDADTAYLINGSSSASLVRFRDVNNAITTHRGLFLRYRWQMAPAASSVIRPYGAPQETYVTSTTPGSTTTGINPASAPSSTAGGLVIETPDLTPTVKTAGFDVELDVPFLRSDAGGTRMAWQLWRWRNGSANACVAAGVVDLVAQNKITRVTASVRDMHAAYLPIHYVLRAGPKNGEGGTLRWIGDESGNAYYGGGFERATMRVREVF